MKNLYFSLLGLVFASNIAFSQSVARDWTKTDCDGISHNLYSELESGKVIILEYVMMNCAPCVTAAKGMRTVVSSFKNSHPDQVWLYATGYSDEYTCEDMENWRSHNGIFSVAFTGGSADVEYYGGMGMPTVVVVGGASHKVYYSKQGYLPSHNAALTEAINLALAEATTDVKEESHTALPSVFPNPAEAELSISLGGYAADRLVLVDITGREVVEQTIQSGASSAVVDTRAVVPGVYSVRLFSKGEIVHSMAVVINRQ